MSPELATSTFQVPSWILCGIHEGRGVLSLQHRASYCFKRSRKMKRAVIFLTIGLFLLSSPLFSQSITDNFYITIDPEGTITGGGSGYNDGEWYVYPSGWINQWFYDHPFDWTRGKIVHIEFDWKAVDIALPVDIVVALNWSTPEYSDLGLGDTEPPLPGCDELLYIIRETFIDLYGVIEEGTQHVIWDFVITDYNPEWVSIDVMGINFEIINGVITHECAIAVDGATWGAVKSLYK